MMIDVLAGNVPLEPKFRLEYAGLFLVSEEPTCTDSVCAHPVRCVARAAKLKSATLLIFRQHCSSKSTHALLHRVSVPRPGRLLLFRSSASNCSQRSRCRRARKDD